MTIDQKVHEQAMAIEKVNFVKTDRLVSPKKTDPFLFLQGTVPVLVSAPHAVRHIRRKEIKQSDIFTGAMACLLHQLTGCHMLAVTRLYGGDPNWDWPCIYKERLSLACRENGIRFVIDLHGAGSERDFDVELGTLGGESFLGKGYLSLIKMALHQAGLKNISVDELFSAFRQNTVTSFSCRTLSIPAVQIEVNRRYRAPQQNGAAFHQCLTGLAAVIEAAAGF